MSSVIKDEKMYHIDITPSQGAKYAILPGDPGRVPKIAEMLDDPREVAYNREYCIWEGYIKGEKVLVCSTGIGGPSASIAVEELFQCGVDTFVRVGTAGGMQLDVEAGDIIVVTGSIRMEGTSREYLPIEFPAVADLDISYALRNASEELGYKTHTGVGQSKDSFYGQHSPERMPVDYELINKWNAWIKGGCLCSEMESAALYTVASTLGARAGAVMLCVWNQERVAKGLSNEQNHDTSSAIKVAVKALEDIIESDRKKADKK